MKESPTIEGLLSSKACINPKPLAKPVTSKDVAALLETILNHSIANRGTDSAFYCCYTYEGSGNGPQWVLDAERTLATLKKQL